MRPVAVVLMAMTAFGSAEAADVPRGAEVIDLDLVPGKFGAVHFEHAEHNAKYKRPDGTPIRCKDCHHRLKGDEPASARDEMKCSGCHAKMTEPERAFDGKFAPPLARLKPDGAIDYKSILFHRYCWACHRKTRRGERMNAGCRVCHERGVTSEIVETRYDSAPQPGAGLSWLRCPAGARWTGKACAGAPVAVRWAEAPAACPAGWRLPTRTEVVSLLDGCSPVSPDAPVRCRACRESPACSRLLGSGEGVTWTSDGAAEEAWTVDLTVGVSRPGPKSERAAVRCVKAGG